MARLFDVIIAPDNFCRGSRTRLYGTQGSLLPDDCAPRGCRPDHGGLTSADVSTDPPAGDDSFGDRVRVDLCRGDRYDGEYEIGDNARCGWVARGAQWDYGLGRVARNLQPHYLRIGVRLVDPVSYWSILKYNILSHFVGIGMYHPISKIVIGAVVFYEISKIVQVHPSMARVPQP